MMREAAAGPYESPGSLDEFWAAVKLYEDFVKSALTGTPDSSDIYSIPNPHERSPKCEHRQILARENFGDRISSEGLIMVRVIRREGHSYIVTDVETLNPERDKKGNLVEGPHMMLKRFRFHPAAVQKTGPVVHTCVHVPYRAEAEGQTISKPVSLYLPASADSIMMSIRSERMSMAERAICHIKAHWQKVCVEESLPSEVRGYLRMVGDALIALSVQLYGEFYGIEPGRKDMQDPTTTLQALARNALDYFGRIQALD